MDKIIFNILMNALMVCTDETLTTVCLKRLNLCNKGIINILMQLKSNLHNQNLIKTLETILAYYDTLLHILTYYCIDRIRFNRILF